MENYRQTILPSDSSQNGPPPNSRWEYHDAGSFDPQIQGMKPAKSLLGGTGVAFLRGEDLAPKPASGNSLRSYGLGITVNYGNRTGRSVCRFPADATDCYFRQELGHKPYCNCQGAHWSQHRGQ